MNKIDWAHIFTPTVAPLELIVRGTVMYFGIMVLVRILLRRGGTAVSIPDILLFVLLADAGQNGMSGEYRSATDGLLLITVILAWAVISDVLFPKIPLLRHLVIMPPVPVIKDGLYLRANMRRHFVSKDELGIAMREEGISNVEEVKLASIESDGKISFIKRERE